jgi:hypothetical protein
MLSAPLPRVLESAVLHVLEACGKVSDLATRAAVDRFDD